MDVCLIYILRKQHLIYIYIYMYMSMYSYIYIYIYIYVYVCIYVCMSIYIYRVREMLEDCKQWYVLYRAYTFISIQIIQNT